MHDECDALVVGAGPAGSAVARRLAARGHHVILVDKASFPRDKCCSEYASPETLRELHALRLLPELDRRGWTPLEGTRVVGAHGAQLHGRFADAGGSPFRATGMALPRRDLDDALVRHATAAGTKLRENTRLTALARRVDGWVTATVSGPTGEWQCIARMVVGADGLGSRVARLSGLRRQGRMRRIAFVAHLSGVRGMGHHAEMHVGTGAYVGLNPIDAARTNVALVVTASDAAHARGDAAGFFHRRLAQFPSLASRLAAAEVVREVMVTGPFDARSLRSTADGLALVGDAAEFFDPFTGEGIWTALVGARLLSDTLDPLLRSADPITDRALKPYRRARCRQFRGKWVVERVIGHAMRWPALFDHSVARLDRAGLASTMIGITGDFVPATAMLRPASVWRLLAARSEKQEARGEPSTIDHQPSTSHI
jgi:flavin-dependent dehydrogenase